MSDNRLYSFEVLIYPDTFIPCNDLPLSYYDVLKQSILDIPYVTNFLLSPCHDKDLKDNSSEFVKAHHHFYVIFSRKFSFEALARFLSQFLPFSIKPNLISRISTDFESCYFYSFHAKSDNKVLYNESDIYTNNARRFKSDYTQGNTAYDIVCDLLDGVSLRLMAKKYGRDFIIHYNSYYSYAMALRSQEELIDEITDVSVRSNRILLTDKF